MYYIDGETCGESGDDRSEQALIRPASSQHTHDDGSDATSTAALQGDESSFDQPHDQDSDQSANNSSAERATNARGYHVTDRVKRLESETFLNITDVISILTCPCEEIQNSTIPNGVKENIYFLVCNKTNQERRERGLKSEFHDDCGAWLTSNAQTTKTAYLKPANPDGPFKHMHCRNGTYCHERQIKGVKQFFPFEPQPDEDSVIHIHRHYCSLKENPQYKKRVTWISNNTHPIALVEYIGQFPGRSKHGNTHNNDDSYCRTPAAVRSALSQQISHGKTPKEIYNAQLHEPDIHNQLRNTQQIYNQKRFRLSLKNSRGNDHEHRSNVADEVLSVINMSQTNDFVKSVTITKGKVPYVILYNDEQISLIKNFCFKMPGGGVC